MRFWTRRRQWRLWEQGKTEPYCLAYAWSSSLSWCTLSWESPYCAPTLTGTVSKVLQSLTLLYAHISQIKWRCFFYSVWTDEASCTIVKSSIVWDVNCSYSCGAECWKSSHYPCLQVYVSVNSSGKVVPLFHNEETQKDNPEVLLLLLRGKFKRSLKKGNWQNGQHLTGEAEGSTFTESIEAKIQSLHKLTSIFSA